MTLSRNIQAKIQEVTAKAPSLKKGDYSPEAGFKFVGIDQFYEEVASLANSIGLNWLTVEEGVELVPLADQVIVLQKFRVDLFDADSGDVAEGAFKLTIPAPFSDAQTAGISLSYLDKCFMRATFKVVTGEKDADHLAKKKPAKVPAKSQEPVQDEVEEEPVQQKKLRGRPPKAAQAEEDSPPWEDQGKPETVNEFKAIADGLLQRLEKLSTTEELDQFRVDEEGQINQLKKAKGDPEADKQMDRVQREYKAMYDAAEKEES